MLATTSGSASLIFLILLHHLFDLQGILNIRSQLSWEHLCFFCVLPVGTTLPKKWLFHHGPSIQTCFCFSGLPLGKWVLPEPLRWSWRHFLNYERHRPPGSQKGETASAPVARDAADVDPRCTKTRGEVSRLSNFRPIGDHGNLYKYRKNG